MQKATHACVQVISIPMQPEFSFLSIETTITLFVQVPNFGWFQTKIFKVQTSCYKWDTILKYICLQIDCTVYGFYCIANYIYQFSLLNHSSITLLKYSETKPITKYVATGIKTPIDCI